MDTPYLDCYPTMNLPQQSHPQRNRTASQKDTQHGAGLLEVLIALLIFSFGLLATAGLQISSLQATQYASQAVVATGLLREYSEMMQLVPASIQKISGAESDNPMFVDTENKDYGATSTNIANRCLGSPCTPSQFAESMAYDWGKRVISDLPNGRAEICQDSTPYDINDPTDPNFKNQKLEWGADKCDGEGVVVLAKIGWTTKAIAKNDTAQNWMTENHPRIAMLMFGNSRDFTK